jgi:gamma-glutamylcyclotransferase (GGCT)/AIG2-like uncharacterized protein YtfP
MYHTLDYLPVFVYGTLRTGQDNWRRLLQGKTLTQRPAIAPDHKMYATNYAYVTDAPGQQIVGELVEIRPECYQRVMQDLDRLEDYDPLDPEHSLYVRVEREVWLVDAEPNERRRAWIYHLNPRRQDSFSDAALVAGGDWLHHCAQMS